jgi:hypothetical protein
MNIFEKAEDAAKNFYDKALGVEAEVISGIGADITVVTSEFHRIVEYFYGVGAVITGTITPPGPGAVPVSISTVPPAL